MRIRWFRQALLTLSTVSLVQFCTNQALAMSTCEICETSIELTQTERDCLIKKIDKIARNKEDPIVVPLSNCSQARGGEQKFGRLPPIPKLGIPTEPNSDGTHKKKNYFYLEKNNVECLRKKISEAPKGNLKIDFSKCKKT